MQDGPVHLHVEVEMGGVQAGSAPSLVGVQEDGVHSVPSTVVVEEGGVQAGSAPSPVVVVVDDVQAGSAQTGGGQGGPGLKEDSVGYGEDQQSYLLQVGIDPTFL